jgi:hypothetical protein
MELASSDWSDNCDNLDLVSEVGRNWELELRTLEGSKANSAGRLSQLILMQKCHKLGAE